MKWSDGLFRSGLAGAGYWHVSRPLSAKEQEELGSAVVDIAVAAVEENLLNRWLDLADRCLDDAENPRYADDDDFVMKCLDRALGSLKQACGMMGGGRS